jgi:hypothetical protein
MDGFDYWANSDGIARIAEDCQRIQIEHIASKFVVFRFSFFNFQCLAILALVAIGGAD